MPVIGWNALFYGKDSNDFFPSLRPDQPIPDKLASGATQGPRVGMKMVKGVYSLLTRMEQLGVGDDSWLAIVASSTRAKRHTLGRDGNVWYTQQGYLLAVAGALDALLLPSPLAAEQAEQFTQQWWNLVEVLTEMAGKAPPYTPDELTRVSRLEQYAPRQPVSEAMMAATDVLYVYLRDLDQMGVIPQPRDYPLVGTGMAYALRMDQRQRIYTLPERDGQVVEAFVEWEDRGSRMEELADACLDGGGAEEKSDRQERMEFGFIKRVRPGFP